VFLMVTLRRIGLPRHADTSGEPFHLAALLHELAVILSQSAILKPRAATPLPGEL